MKSVKAVFLTSDPWYVVHCKSAREQYTANVLEHLLGLTTYVPEIVLCSGKEMRRVPFFPGYLFLQADLSKIGIHCINSSPGVLRLVDFGGGPVEVPSTLIEIIREEVNRQRSGISSQQLSSGDLVQIIEGPLAGLRATFLEAKTSDDRARVLLHLLGRLSKAQLDASTLKKVDAEEDGHLVAARRERGTRGRGRRIRRLGK